MTLQRIMFPPHARLQVWVAELVASSGLWPLTVGENALSSKCDCCESRKDESEGKEGGLKKGREKRGGVGEGEGGRRKEKKKKSGREESFTLK